MNKRQNDEHFYKLSSKAFHEVVVPELGEIKDRLDNMEKNMATKEHLDTLDRKYNAVQDKLDNHGKRIEKLEKQTSVAS